MKSAEKLVIVCFLFKGVLCREFSISLPESVEAVRGLCVLIPCSFEIEEQYDGDLQKDPTGIWLKDSTDPNNNRVFNSKVTEENKIEGEIIGDLRMKNCTTVFYNIRQNYSGDYYFRLETSGKLKWNYKSPSVSVRVGASPITPSITLYKEDQGKVEDQNELVEGTSVSLICSAPAPPCLLKPPTFTWNFLPEERRQEQNHNTRFSSSQLNFNATHLHHGLNFTCTATYQLQNRNKSTQSSFILHVLYAPQISPFSSCNTTQDLIMCSCEVHGNPSPKLEWRVSGQSVKSIWEESVNSTTSRSFISINQSVKDKPTLQCVVSNKMGTKTLLFNPNISERRVKKISP
ncbi:sialic acid-binding Ig-like lectin 7 [Ictalurus furcatus]|uniref:sialic acid-binding Ig-like lectin 7 n=1 Tax=Ictalurus furcatus TaxID=66913 RepID=UPI00235066BD|nr:sialic acid-binding Ig-like lectin 7 [Ictalurus furcatus]